VDISKIAARQAIKRSGDKQQPSSFRKFYTPKEVQEAKRPSPPELRDRQSWAKRTKEGPRNWMITLECAPIWAGGRWGAGRGRESRAYGGA